MKKKIVLRVLIPTVLLVGMVANTSYANTISSTEHFSSSINSTKSSIRAVNKQVTTTKETALYLDASLSKSTMVEAGSIYQVTGSLQIGSENYYQVLYKDQSFYVKASDVTDFKKVIIKKRLISGVKEWNYYKNFDWKVKGKIIKGMIYSTNGYYELGNGEKYYSISREKNGKSVWYGYVNARAMKNLTLHKDEKNLTVFKNYKTYSNFFWKDRSVKNVGKNYKTEGYYILGDGRKYYTLYQTDDKNKRKWRGYMNAKGLKELKAKPNYYKMKVIKKDYTLWSNFFWSQKKGLTSKYYHKLVTVKYSYKTGNGNTYYSLYDGKTWLGYVNSKSLINQYYSSNPKIIRMKQGAKLYKDAARKRQAGIAKKDDYFKVYKLIHEKGKLPVLKLSNGYYITANKNYVAKTKGYQNPKQYYQISYSQIKPYGTVGYNLNLNYEGVKTYMVMCKLGTYYGYNCYNMATKNAVYNFQIAHGLKATGIVDKKTWVKLGFSEKSWTLIDSYIAPLKVHAWDGRQKHIEAMINQAYRYLGNKYLEGASSSPSYGIDCSGLVMQSLYAGGLNVAPISSINHASPGNEYNSRNLWASDKLKRVPYSNRQRGDLIFYYQPGTTTIYHVAIYLGNNQVIESWPPKVTIWPIRNNQRWVIAGVKRPFI